MSVYDQEVSNDRSLLNNIDRTLTVSRDGNEHYSSPPPENDHEQHARDEPVDGNEEEHESSDEDIHSHSRDRKTSGRGHDGPDYPSALWGRVPPESRAFKAAARTGYRPGDDWRDLPRDPRIGPHPRPTRPREDHPLALMRERAGHWLDDHLPATLQGRWRLDRRTGIILATALTAVAVLFGGWELFRDRTEQVTGTRLISTGQHGRHDDDTSGSSSGSSSTHSHHSHFDDGESGMNQDDPMTMPNASEDASGGADSADSADGSGSGHALGAGRPPIIVDVEGKVARPGVQRLPAGSRVQDAVRAAGGALAGADLAPLNQARVLNDGEQVVVGAPQDPAAAASPTGPHAKARGKQQVSEPVHLNSATVDQLEQLPGVGPAMAQRILDWRTEHGGFATVEQLREVRGLGGQRFAALSRWIQL
ncbi:MAG TPA: ComEA family DNA-binding protein [Actinocrinis sp.]